MVVFFSQIFRGDFVPYMTAMTGMSECVGLYDVTAIYLPIRGHLDTFNPTSVTAVRPSLNVDEPFVYNDILLLRKDDSTPVASWLQKSSKLQMGRSRTYETGMA